MSKEIKFRAWDKDRKEFLSAGQILLAINPNKYPKSTDFYLDVYDEKYKNAWRDRFEIQQFTGLFDKNAREIYEGDIVKIDGYIELFVIKWVCDTARYGLQSNDELLYFEFGIGSRIEVVGNVYENSGLLKEAGNE